ncbi:MAG: hypothetical protein K2F60_01405, partial [Oscillospiraceae bacterium]|nr:hypothetical protein [Oscillospiraceae bacterium]
MSGGVVAGSVMVCASDDLHTISRSIFTQNLLKTTEIKTLIEIYLNAFIPLATALILQYICGFSALGQPLTVAGIIYRGISTGIAASI